MPNTPEDELRKEIQRNAHVYYDPSGDHVVKIPIDDLMQLITQHTDRKVAEARLDERKQVALDNYHGHTFSDATNYKGKFDKFVENNERRIKQLKKGIGDE